MTFTADQVLATERNRAFLISERIDQTEYIARIERANDERNKAHDKACAACKNINDIAESVGFHNFTQFYRKFKKFYHVTPREYRLAYASYRQKDS